MPRLALVTILYKCDDVLEDFFKSISIQTFKEYKLYLIDNSANEKTDRIIADCKNKYPITDFTYINANGNIGVAAGNNIGIKKAIEEGCTSVLILNNDILIEQDFVFEKLMKLGEREMMITPKILYYDDRKIWMAGGFMDYSRALGVHYGMKKTDAEEYNIPRYITYAPTCFLMVRAEVFNEIGLMDEKYFAYYDDTDFILRAIRKGFKLWYEPSVFLLHKVSSSSGGDSSPFYIYYGNRNKIYFIRKNFSGIKKYFLLFYTLMSRIIFYLKFDTAGRKNLVKGIKDGFNIPVN